MSYWLLKPVLSNHLCNNFSLVNGKLKIGKYFDALQPGIRQTGLFDILNNKSDSN